jgi:hypothetical protein
MFSAGVAVLRFYPADKRIISGDIIAPPVLRIDGFSHL